MLTSPAGTTQGCAIILSTILCAVSFPPHSWPQKQLTQRRWNWGKQKRYAARGLPARISFCAIDLFRSGSRLFFYIIVFLFWYLQDINFPEDYDRLKGIIDTLKDSNKAVAIVSASGSL